jgi:hypothetical protein
MTWKTSATNLFHKYDTEDAFLLYVITGDKKWSLSPLFRTKIQHAINAMAPHKFSKAKEIQQCTISRKNKRKQKE